MRIAKDYGVVVNRGSREYRLQKEKGSEGISLVSYRDGMSVGSMEFTKAEAKALQKLLADHLGWKAPERKSEEVSDVVKSLTSLPTSDCGYATALCKATKTDLEQAIEIMKKGGRNATRIKACENALKRIEQGKKVSTKKAEVKVEPAKVEEKPKIVEFPTEDKRPQIIKLQQTSEARTYGECVAKLKKEAEMFKDSDSQYVIEGLLELCKVDEDFRNNLMREEKTYGGFMEYMFKAAQNGYCVRYGNVGWVDRDLGLGLAIDYFNADSEKMEAEEKKKREEEAAKRKAEIKTTTTKKRRGRPKKKGA